MRTTFFALALTIGVAAPSLAQSQPLKLDFHDGLVTVEANAVPVRTILTEWGKLGGTKIVGAERISGAPLTLKLVNVSESKALESILRSVAGYMAAPRTTRGEGPSMYDRILVMATSSTPAPATASARPPAPQPNGPQRFAPPRPAGDQDEPEPQSEPDDNPPNAPVFTFPQPGQQNGAGQPGQFNGAPASQPGQNVAIPNPTGNGGTQGVTINPATPAGRPGMPVGVSTPGMMVNPTPPQQPNQPGTMIKPPGRDQ
ncbi:MAG TPA: hypothetical protein VEA16_11225 [Vicinamibacterales bacterium]|nr:hypothetical protein [Vicinamibacterales bacterium]